MSDINRHDVDLDEKGNKIQNVKSTKFTQNPNNNTDVLSSVDLYYTDLDISSKAELFMQPSDAHVKAQNLWQKFPNHIVKFFMFYYEAPEGQSFTGVKQSLCQVIPGTKWVDEEKRYRAVNKQSLKSIYNKIDFITIYRPKNTIKWYTVSKEELKEELAVIKEFYGLTNFPDKEGDFYFSKKIGKWLATTELADIIDSYDQQHRQIPVLYPDMITSDGVIPVEKKSIWEIFWDYVKGIYDAAANAIEDTAKAIEEWVGNSTFLENFEKWFQDEDKNFIPDRADELIALFNQYVVDPASKNLNEITKSLDTNLGIKIDANENITNLPNKIKTFGDDLTNALNIIKEQASNWFQNFKLKVQKFFKNFNWN